MRGQGQRERKETTQQPMPNRHAYREGPKDFEFVLFWGESEAKQESTVIVGNVREGTI